MQKSTKIPLTDVPRRLRVSYSRAWQLVLAGELDGEKDGGRWLVTTESIEAYAASSIR